MDPAEEPTRLRDRAGQRPRKAERARRRRSLAEPSSPEEDGRRRSLFRSYPLAHLVLNKIEPLLGHRDLLTFPAPPEPPCLTPSGRGDRSIDRCGHGSLRFAPEPQRLSG